LSPIPPVGCIWLGLCNFLCGAFSSEKAFRIKQLTSLLACSTGVSIRLDAYSAPLAGVFPIGETPAEGYHFGCADQLLGLCVTQNTNCLPLINYVTNQSLDVFDYVVDVNKCEPSRSNTPTGNLTLKILGSTQRSVKGLEDMRSRACSSQFQELCPLFQASVLV